MLTHARLTVFFRAARPQGGRSRPAGTGSARYFYGGELGAVLWLHDHIGNGPNFMVNALRDVGGADARFLGSMVLQFPDPPALFFGDVDYSESEAGPAIHAQAFPEDPVFRRNCQELSSRVSYSTSPPSELQAYCAIGQCAWEAFDTDSSRANLPPVYIMLGSVASGAVGPDRCAASRPYSVLGGESRQAMRRSCTQAWGGSSLGGVGRLPAGCLCADRSRSDGD